MTILFMESGSDATQGLEWWDGSGGTVTSDSSIKNTGPRSIKFIQTISVVALQKLTIASRGSGTLSFYIQLTTTPAANTYFAFLGNSSGWSIGRDTSNRLILSEGTTVRGTGTTALDNNVWALVQISWSWTNSTTNTFKVWLNGVLEINASNITMSQGQTSMTMQFTNGNGANGDATYLDDVYLDDVFNSNYPGDIRVTAKLPASLNTNNFDTLGGSGTNRYDRVSDRPLSVTNYIQHAAASDVQENFGLQASSAGDVDISDKFVVGYCGWVYAKRGAFDTAFVRQIGTVQTKT